MGSRNTSQVSFLKKAIVILSLLDSLHSKLMVINLTKYEVKILWIRTTILRTTFQLDSYPAHLWSTDVQEAISINELTWRLMLLPFNIPCIIWQKLQYLGELGTSIYIYIYIYIILPKNEEVCGWQAQVN